MYMCACACMQTIKERIGMSKPKVEQSAVTMLGVEVDKDEVSKKLFQGFDFDDTIDRVRHRKPTKGEIVSELMNDESFMDELLQDFSK